MSSLNAPILELKRISKFFPGIRALDCVNLSILPGEVHALLGENGAGKSTLVKIITGIYKQTAGEILFRGNPVVFPNPLEAQKAGITAIHQEASMFPELTVMENIFMGHQLKTHGRLDWRTMKKETRQLLEKMELKISPDSLVKNLSTAHRHMVEIAKALSIDADVVIMDEPTSALTQREVDDLYYIIRQLKEQGKAILFISHKFEEIFEICDAFTVYRDGRFIGEGKVAESSVDEMVSMMVGRPLSQMFPKKETRLGNVLLEAKNLSQSGSFQDISFKLHRGEILGFFGLIGAGRTEVTRVLFGLEPRSSGNIYIDGNPVRFRTPKHAMKKGIALIPEDRQSQGIIQKISINNNITLTNIDEMSFLGILNAKAEMELTRHYGTLMEIKAAGWHVNTDTLSGGNQQKVVIAKWLATKPKILIMDEPTKGIDVATKAAVHRFVSRMTSQGLGVILISSELPEILGVADRIIVMHEGRITAKFNRDEANSEKIIRAATGQPAQEVFQ